MWWLKLKLKRGGEKDSISWIGIHAVEVTFKNHTKDTKNIGIIIRKADEAIPTYNEAKDKASFLTRSLATGNTTKIYTAIHYGTNDALGTATGKNFSPEQVVLGDILTPVTPYKLYIFENKAIVNTLLFSTKADINTKANWGDAPTQALTFTNPLPPEDTLHTKKGELFLFPFLIQVIDDDVFKIFSSSTSTNVVFASLEISNDTAPVWIVAPKGNLLISLRKYFDDSNTHRSFIVGRNKENLGINFTNLFFKSGGFTSKKIYIKE